MNQQVRELHALLARGSCRRAIRVGRSPIRGRIDRVYAKACPREAVVMVLIDPGTLNDDHGFPPERGRELAPERRMIIIARLLPKCRHCSRRTCIEHPDRSPALPFLQPATHAGRSHMGGACDDQFLVARHRDRDLALAS
jgi:hypothetical protein